MFWNLLPLSIRRKLEAPYRYDAYFAVRKILERAGGRKLRVLDAGAGDCFAKSWFRGHEYVAMDIARSDLIFDGNSLNVLGDIQDMPFESHCFDIVVALEVLEHVKEPERALAEIYRVLKKDGICIFSTPLMAVGFHNDYFRFSPQALEMILSRAGFALVEIKPTGGYYRMLGHQLSKISYRVRKPVKVFFLPLYYAFKIPIGLVFQIIIPFFLFYIDFLDKEKKDTCGYIVIANSKKRI